MVPTLWGSSLAFVVAVIMVGFTLYQVVLIASTVISTTLNTQRTPAMPTVIAAGVICAVVVTGGIMWLATVITDKDAVARHHGYQDKGQWPVPPKP